MLYGDTNRDGAMHDETFFYCLCTAKPSTYRQRDEKHVANDETMKPTEMDSMGSAKMCGVKLVQCHISLFLRGWLIMLIC